LYSLPPSLFMFDSEIKICMKCIVLYLFFSLQSVFPAGIKTP
jgi:hypothetical protein